MTADLQAKSYSRKSALYMAMELSDKQWRLAFGDGTRQRQVVVAADDIAALSEQIAQAKAKRDLSANCPVVSCYEAGRDGFWLHRQLTELGIANRVVDAASIEVSRRARRAKSDRLDARSLLEKLIRSIVPKLRLGRIGHPHQGAAACADRAGGSASHVLAISFRQFA
jgi:transposase